ncbi:MAG: GatB/YqeY domain-containing protein [Synergistaceae bacterium]|nr:GatB/YqeY domain-containing protein [Synergistaceae bacterium]
MTNLGTRIANDLVTAMKAKDELSLSVLRMLKSSMQLVVAEHSKDYELTEDEILTLVRRLIKQRKEAAEMYLKGKAADRAERELAEARVLEAYLPAQLSLEKIEEIVAETAKAVGATSQKDMGRLMGSVMAKVKGQADGSTVRNAVSSFLSKL